MRLNRREVLSLAIGAGITALAGCSTVSRQGSIFSAFENARGDQFVGGVSLPSGEVFGAQVPMRAHGCALDPRDASRVLFFARRPGATAFVYDRESNRAHVAFDTPPGRHLSGHGVFSANGDVLYTPEHAFERAKGVIAVRDARSFKIVEEFDTRGIDPHELAWLPGQRRLLIANGGILTHPRSYREKLNLNSMDPSLCVLDAASGESIEQWRLPDHQLSIRHLSVSSDGTAAVGLQYEGDKARSPCVVAQYQPGHGLRLLPCPPDAIQKMRAYVASVCVSDDEELITASCPYGAGVACWSKRTGEFQAFVPGAEVFGLSRLADGEVLASLRDGQAFSIDKSGRQSQFVTLVSAEPIRWDDHWVAAG